MASNKLSAHNISFNISHVHHVLFGHEIRKQRVKMSYDVTNRYKWDPKWRLVILYEQVILVFADVVENRNMKSVSKRNRWFRIFYLTIHTHIAYVPLHWPRDKLPIDPCLLFGNKSYFFGVKVIAFQPNGPHISYIEILRTYFSKYIIEILAK